MTGLDRTDLAMARVAIAWYIRAHHINNRAVPAAAWRLSDHLDAMASASGPKPVVPHPHWVTTAQAAERLGCSTRHARRIARKIGERVGRQWLIDPDALPESTP